MDQDLYASIRRLLFRVANEEEALPVVASARRLPTYQMTRGTQLWQLGSLNYEQLCLLWHNRQPCIIRLPNKMCVFLGYAGSSWMRSVQSYSERHYVPVGPTIRSSFGSNNGANGGQQVNYQLLLSQTSIPFGHDDLEVIKGHLQDILRLLLDGLAQELCFAMTITMVDMFLSIIKVVFYWGTTYFRPNVCVNAFSKTSGCKEQA
jgi:hypothetical protein